MKKLKSIRTWLTKYYVSFITLLILAIALVNAVLMFQSMLNSTLERSYQSLSETGTSIDIALDRVQMLAALINNNAEIQNLFVQLAEKENGINIANEVNLKQELLQHVSNIIVADRSIVNVTLFSYDGSHYSTYEMRTSHADHIQYFKDRFGDLSAQYGAYSWTGLHAFNEQIRVITFQRHFVNNSTIHNIGRIFVCLNQNYLESLLNQSETSSFSTILLLDKEKNIIAENSSVVQDERMKAFLAETSMPSEQTFRMVRVEKKPYILQCKTLSNASMLLVSLVPFSETFYSPLVSLLFVTLFGAAGIVTCILLSMNMAKKITEPLHHMLNSMIEVENNNLDADFSDDTFVETHEIGQGIAHMLSTVNQLTNQLHEGEIRQKETELEMLKAQINPHFIYNTLETVNALLLVDGREELSEIITDLSDILRYNVNRFGRIVRLCDEFENIRKYLHIQQIRNEDSHCYHMEITQEAASCRVLNMIIHPFIENAIQHGMSGMREKYNLYLSAWKENDFVWIQVEDDGNGMPQETIEKVMSAERSQDEQQSHIGMRTTIRRINLFYGECAQILIRSEVGHGTTILLKLPILPEEVI